jgi:hypothetical protein
MHWIDLLTDDSLTLGNLFRRNTFLSSLLGAIRALRALKAPRAAWSASFVRFLLRFAAAFPSASRQDALADRQKEPLE